MSRGAQHETGGAVPDAPVRCVLFDLDGTIADTAPDLGEAINACLRARGRAPLAIAELRPWASHGARGMIHRAFGVAPGEAQYDALRDEFLANYAGKLCARTTLFEGVEETLACLESEGLVWGIVTNKISRLTDPLVRALGLAERAACVVSADSAGAAKPDPAPIQLALARCASLPRHSVYVGDDRRDVIAGRAAGVRTVAAAYGYSAAVEDISQWAADHVIDTPKALLAWIFRGRG